MKLTLVTLLAAAAGYLVTHRAADELARRAAVRGRNHRGIEIAATGGIALVLGLLAAAFVSILARAPWSDTAAPLLTIARDQLAIGMLAGVAFAGVGFGLLGLYDDVAGTGSERGWRAHADAVRHGRATPGGIKLAGGAALGLLLAPATSVPDLLVAAAVIALAANLVNAFDLKPLRAAKASILWLAILLVGALLAAEVRIVPAVLVLGAILAALWKPEAAERIMLGDVGANALGAALGWLSVSSVDTRTARLVVLLVLVGLTVLSAKPGFSALIARIPLLRRADLLGRQPDPIPVAPLPDEPV